MSGLQAATFHGAGVMESSLPTASQCACTGGSLWQRNETRKIEFYFHFFWLRSGGKVASGRTRAALTRLAARHARGARPERRFYQLAGRLTGSPLAMATGRGARAGAIGLRKQTAHNSPRAPSLSVSSCSFPTSPRPGRFEFVTLLNSMNDGLHEGNQPGTKPFIGYPAYRRTLILAVSAKHAIMLKQR